MGGPASATVRGQGSDAGYNGARGGGRWPARGPRVVLRRQEPPRSRGVSVTGPPAGAADAGGVGVPAAPPRGGVSEPRVGAEREAQSRAFPPAAVVPALVSGAAVQSGRSLRLRS